MENYANVSREVRKWDVCIFWCWTEKSEFGVGVSLGGALARGFAGAEEQRRDGGGAVDVQCSHP